MTTNTKWGLSNEWWIQKRNLCTQRLCFLWTGLRKHFSVKTQHNKTADDTEIECAILTVFPVEKQEYIALLPLDENGQNQSGEVYLYKFSRTETGDPILANIESDDEYAKAAEAYDVVLDNARKAEAAGEPLE